MRVSACGPVYMYWPRSSHKTFQRCHSVATRLSEQTLARSYSYSGTQQELSSIVQLCYMHALVIA